MDDDRNEEAITVVFCSDDNYAMQMAVAIKSLVLNHSTERPLEIFLLSDGIAPENRRKLLDCVEQHPSVSLKWTELAPALMSGFRPVARDPRDVVRLSGRVGLAAAAGVVSRAAYVRLLIPEILPSNLEKAIYLDGDVLVLSDIEELWRKDVSGHVILAAQDYDNVVSTPGHFPNYRHVGIPGDNRYFNSGVLVVNMKLWRSQGIAELCLEYLRKFDKSRVFNDQEALNAVLFSRWSSLERHWNWQDPFYETAFPGMLRRWLRRLRRGKSGIQPGIIHYCGLRKPWHPGYLGEQGKLFFHYLDATPWAGWRTSKIAGFWVVGRYDLPLAVGLLMHHAARPFIRGLRRAGSRLLAR